MRIRAGAVAALSFILIVGACSSDADDGASTETSEPSVNPDATATVTVDPVPANTLTAAVSIDASEAVSATVTVDGDVSFEVPPGAVAEEQRIPVVGMHPNSSYELDVELLDEEGRIVEHDGASLTFETGDIPERNPEVRVEVFDAEAVSPGYTMFNFIDLGGLQGTDELPPEDAPQFGTIMIVDEIGEPVWYFTADRVLADARMLDNGNFLFEHADISAYEVNLFGEVVNEWGGRIATEIDPLDANGRPRVGPDVIPVDIDAMHHEHLVLPNGNHLTLTTELRVIEGFPEPLCGEDPATFAGDYHLVGDIAVEFDPETGEVVKSFNLFDYFDPTVDITPFDVCDGPSFVFPNSLYRDRDPEAEDWTHANSVILDEERNALIISVRHVDTVIAIRYSDDDSGSEGDLLWKLSHTGDLEMLDDGFFTYHQHAAEVWPDGSILIYDNGNLRASHETDGPDSTRVVRYEIDDEAKTARTVWELPSVVNGEEVFATFVGDADLLDNGNVLITDGAVVGQVGDVSAQILEVTPELPEGGTPVWQLQILGGQNWGAYRAERLPTLYPATADAE